MRSVPRTAFPNRAKDPIPKKDYDFALAPDGSKLAVMTDDKLAVYAIRPRTAFPNRKGGRVAQV
jgi:hypothetical protein